MSCTATRRRSRLCSRRSVTLFMILTPPSHHCTYAYARSPRPVASPPHATRPSAAPRRPQRFVTVRAQRLGFRRDPPTRDASPPRFGSCPIGTRRSRSTLDTRLVVDGPASMASASHRLSQSLSSSQRPEPAQRGYSNGSTGTGNGAASPSMQSQPQSQAPRQQEGKHSLARVTDLFASRKFYCEGWVYKCVDLVRWGRKTDRIRRALAGARRYGSTARAN